MNRWIFIGLNVVLLGLILAAIPFVMKTRQPYEHNSQGVQALNAQKYDEAIILLKGAVDRKPDNADFRHNLLAAYNSKAINLAGSGQEDEALEYYAKALELKPGDQILLRNYISSLNNLAVEFSNSKNFVESQKFFEQASAGLMRLTDAKMKDDIRHNYSALLTLWGTELMRRNQTAEASKSFAQSLDLDPKNAVAHVYLGDLGYESNDYPLAKRHYSAALPLDAENKDYLSNRLQMIDDESAVEARFKTLRDPKGRFLIQHVEYARGVSVTEILALLNEAYDTIGKDLGIYPARTVNVKIYAATDFSKISKLPEWAIGIFDGKLRLKVDEVQSAPSQVKDLIFHEYTHAVLSMNVKQKVPAWFHEGMAQLMEPQFKESPSEQAQMRDALAKNQLDFAHLQNSFKDIQAHGEAENAYLLSKYFLAYLNRKHGHEKLTAWVKEMTGEKPFEQSFTTVYQMAIADAQKEWIKAQAK